ncbi:MAG: hypothetical protein KTR32_37600, partial [Granulosicoccus sp.]|nr:hypothetical protein [Granulosicoccus sp.]
MGYDATIKRLDVSAIIDIQGEQSRIAEWAGNKLPPFPDVPNSASISNGLNLYWVGRMRWLLRADISREQELLSVLRPSEAPAEISVVQISDTLQFFSIRGPEAEDVISVVTPLDFHSTVFPQYGVSYTDICGRKGL